MFCTPPATTTSAVPDMTAWAAKCTACCEEPHCRSTVVPGTWSGSPAASQAVLAMSPACGPTVSTQPNTTSSTAPGSRPTRSTSAVRTDAPRSAGWMAASPPPRLPTGLRTASTMNASGMLPRPPGGRHGEALQEERRHVLGQLVSGVRAVGPVPPDGEPHRVPDQPVEHPRRYVVAEAAIRHPGRDHLQPGLLDLGGGRLDLAEARHLAQVLALVLVNGRRMRLFLGHLQ